MSKTRVLITGITGFAGSHLAELLISKNNFEIFGTHVSERNLDNLSEIKDKIKLYKVNLLDTSEALKIISEVKPEILFHLAASTSVFSSFKNPAEVLINNISSQVNVLEALRLSNMLETKVIIISSGYVYGYAASSDLPIDEKVPFKPDNPYSVSKITQDYLGYSYFMAYKMPVVRLRPFNHVGPRLSPQISISRFAKIIAEIEKGISEPLMKVGNLESKRDFTDVKDMVYAYMLAAEKGIPGEDYNIGTGISLSIKEMLNKLLSMSRVAIKVEVDSSLFRPSDIPDLRGNPEKFQKATGWRPTIPIEDTLKRTLDYWRGIV